MKYHKIRGVNMNVCTAEQKIAYNLAFRASVSYMDAYKKARSASAVCVSDVLHQIVENELEAWSYNPDYCKYNADAINAALNAGIRGYMEAPFIATSYEEIGAAFPARYL